MTLFRHPLGRSWIQGRAVLGRDHLCAWLEFPGGSRPPGELGCGSGVTCWRRLRDWHAAGVWEHSCTRLRADLCLVPAVLRRACRQPPAVLGAGQHPGSTSLPSDHAYLPQRRI
jgi:hypothetical protein